MKSGGLGYRSVSACLMVKIYIIKPLARRWAVGGGRAKKHGRLLFSTKKACIMVVIYIIKPLSRGGYE